MDVSSLRGGTPLNGEILTHLIGRNFPRRVSQVEELMHLVDVQVATTAHWEMILHLTLIY